MYSAIYLYSGSNRLLQIAVELAPERASGSSARAHVERVSNLMEIRTAKNVNKVVVRLESVFPVIRVLTCGVKDFLYIYVVVAIVPAI